MKKLAIFLLPLFFITTTNTVVLSQRGPVEIQWSGEYKEPRSSILTEFIGNDERYSYALRLGIGEGLLSKEGSIFVEKYNSKMKLVKTSEIKLIYKKKRLFFENIQMIGGQIYLFTSFRNKKKKMNFLFVQTINKKTLKLEKDIRVISSVPFRAQYNSGAFNLEFSRDSSKILVLGQLPYQAKAQEKYQIKVLDKSLNPIWNKEIQLPYDDQRFEIEQYRIDREGNVYLLGLIQKDLMRKKRNGKPTYQYTLLTYSQEGEKVKEYKINLKDKFITDLTFRIQKNGDPVCAGFYSDRNSFSIRGTYFFKINKSTGKVYNQGLKEFDFEFLTELMSERNKKRAEKAEKQNDEKKQVELYRYNLDKLILRSDGGAVLVAEQFFIKIETSQYRDIQGYWRTRTQRRYYYNDIIVVNINPKGEIDWASHIPKRQITLNDGGYFSSYAVAVTSKAIYFVFNDNPKNFGTDKKTNKIHSFNGTRSVVTLAEVKPNGSVTKYPLFSNREEGILTRPKVCKQNKKNEMIIYGEKLRKYKFAKVVFK